MKLPFSFDLDGRKVRVEEKWLGKLTEGYGIGGQCVRRKDEDIIYISPGMTKRGQAHTFLHELMHLCLYRAGEESGGPKVEYLLDALDGWLFPLLMKQEVVDALYSQ